MAAQKIAVIGSGLMGHALAHIFATAGHQVWLYDLSEELLAKAKLGIASNLDKMQQAGLLTAKQVLEIPELIHTTTDLAFAVQAADFVVEAVPENMELKQGIFKQLDELCKPEAILASNTSVMSITAIAAQAKNRHRIVGTHFWNPPHLIPLVEVVQAADTSLATVEFTMQLLRSVGKHPVHCKKDVPGFIANRMQHALWREALHIVETGIADAATVDEAVCLSFGLRLPQLGPLANADLVGLDLTLAIHEYIFPHLNHSQVPSALLKAKNESGELGFKTKQGLQAWSDAEIAAVRNNLQAYLLRVAAS